MTTLLVGSRKGLFTIHRGDAGWKLGTPAFPGEPVTQVLADPRTGAWYAALRLGHFGVKLKRSLDRGMNWEEVAAPAFPEKPKEGPFSDDETPWTVDLVWSLESAPGRLWAGCLPAGLFHSDDQGASWKLVKSLWERPDRREWMGGGYDHAGIDSICVDPRDAKHLTVAVSTGGVWETRDAGESWEGASQGLDAIAYMPPERRYEGNMQDVHRMDACAAHPDSMWIQHHGGMFRSTDGAKHWETIPSPKPSGFGFAVVAHPADPERAWFAPAHSDQNRVPVDGRMVVNETRDGGKTFITHTTGLPQKDAYHLVYRHALACTPDGKTLAMGSTTGGLWVSEDEGTSWQCLSRDLPPIAAVRFAQ